MTVLALCYNHFEYLVECLESIKRQSYQDIELVVTDDFSRDGSAELIDRWLARNYPDATFLRHRSNRGICKTLNEALRVSRGDFISMIATDDVWEPAKIERQLEAMASSPPETAVVYSDAVCIDASGETIAPSFIDWHRPGLRPPSGNIFHVLADGNFIPAMATLIRRSAIDEIGGYDEDLTYEDYDMWLRLSHRFPFAYLPDVVAKYRLLPTSVVRTQFGGLSPAHSYSRFLICEKWLSTPHLSARQRSEWQTLEAQVAYSLYVHDDSRAAACLRTAAMRTRSPRLGLRALAASVGISRNTAKSIVLRGGFR